MRPASCGCSNWHMRGKGYQAGRTFGSALRKTASAVQEFSPGVLGDSPGQVPFVGRAGLEPATGGL